MRRVQPAILILAWLGLTLTSSAEAAGIGPEDYRPDPYAVQRYGPAYRYPQAGWIVLHVEGQPYERGYQHGRLLASEIAAYLRCSAAIQNSEAPKEGWRTTRSLVNALFVRRYDREYLEEMKGIADGATAAGARFDGRPIDLVDIVALNAWPELETLDSALQATPTGLEGIRFPDAQPRIKQAPKPMHCSAFAATGPATADGKIVFGHITMFSLYPSLFYNVWLDVKPAKGHRVLMQTYPGGIQSGMDYYLNDAGLLVCETTIRQTRFDVQGMALASRIRQALQYADSIDKAVEILKKANNGLYTNEWLLADIKTNEIAMFELGTAKSKLYRSSKNEWFGGTEGFYWGCNNVKDLQVRLETIPSVKGRPANVIWRPSDRDKVWLRLYQQHKGKIDAGFGKEAFTTPPIAAYHSLDAKFTTTDLARDLKTWALFGPPLGRTWEPSQEERRRYPEARPMVSNPWTILHPFAPDQAKPASPLAVDLKNESAGKDKNQDKSERSKRLAKVPAWHGTLLPKTDADIWLAAAFADYERIALRRQKREGKRDNGQTTRDRERLAVELFGYRANYTAGARAGGDIPLAKTHPELTQNDWYRVASGKGVLVLHELHQLLGDETFTGIMDTFGREHAGREVSVAMFRAHVEKVAGKDLGAFFTYWTEQPGLPMLQLGRVSVLAEQAQYRVEGEIRRPLPASPMAVEVTVETAGDEVTKTVRLEGAATPFAITTEKKPKRVVVDKYGLSTRANGGPFSIRSFYPEWEKTLIVYGTQDEVPTNREGAEVLQQAIIKAGSNFKVPIKSDQEVTEADLKDHHLLLVGRPDCNRCVGRVRAGLPVTFGHRSFQVREERYAHPGSAVIAAAENPWNSRYSVVVLAGLGAESTRQIAAELLNWGRSAGEVVVRPAGKAAKTLVAPARDLIQELHVDGRRVER
jgi:hypothetical protein